MTQKVKMKQFWDIVRSEGAKPTTLPTLLPIKNGFPVMPTSGATTLPATRDMRTRAIGMPDYRKYEK